MYVKLLTNNFLSEKAVGKSESKDVHLAVLRVLPEVIRESVDAERHADYRKGEGGKGTEGERRDAGRIVAVNQGKRDGSGVDEDASSKSVIVYDPATGEKKMVSPTAVDGIESLGEVKTAEQREAEINAHMQDTIQRSKDWLEGNVANPVGMQIQLGDGRIATIEAMHEDGKSAIATLPDGTQFIVPNDVLQMIVNYGQYADYKARRDAEASKREAEQSTESAPETATEGGQPLPEEASPKEEESREYAQGDVFDVVVDGNKMHAEIVSPKDADGRFVVNVDDGESMRTLYVTPEELAAMEYREEPSPKAEETRLATEDSSDKAFERGAQPTEEHTPTALERIPRDEKGNAQFHDVDTETAWDGLVEMSGNEETAHKVAEASLANAEKRLKAAKALKEKGETPEELLRSIKENEAAAAEAQRVVDSWKAIVGEKSRREEAAKAEAERIATEKAEAERKAAEERERAEAEEEARVEAERKAEEERKTKEEERKERDENGQPFVVSSDGTTTFGEITEDTGLTVAPIKLSEGVADEKGNGYGLRHIEARHGDQIRKAGFSSVEEFVKYVASNYDKHNIKIGKKRANGVETYLIQAEDEHSNVLYVELSKDGSYWNVNSGGIFRKGYAEKKKDVGQNTEHPTSATTLQDKSFVQTDKDNGSQSADTHSDKQHPSADKGTTLPADQQSSDKENTKKVADSEGENTLKAKIEAASADVNTDPTEAQKEAGNYKKGHVQVGAFDITIEQPEGSIRRGTDADGKQWESKMHNTYGYFRGTEGVDGDHIDVFLSNDIDGWNGRKVFVVDQYNPDGTFDEHKVMLGFNDMDEAKSDYLANYEKGWENGRRIDISSTNLEDFEKWIDSSHRKTKPFSEYSSVNKETVATDKGGEKAEKKQKKQSVFDKAKEIADKEEKKRKAEAEKPKQKPLTEAERKDAEEVAGALGYRVEWVDTMEENGTIDAYKKVIRIAKDAENPLVQVLGHEVAHGVKRMDGGKFKALQKAAMEVVCEKEWNERIEKKRKLNAYAEGKLAEEVTCDIVGEALNDKDALKRLAESLRGERGILARLRDAVARMVEYFKNRGDKEGVRRMKAADKLLAEFESALKEGVAPEQVKPEDVDRSVRESRSEKTELTAEERELRDNLVERMRKGGLDVVTDSEEMQRVIDTENERTRNMFVGEKGATEADKAEEVSSRLDNLSVARRMEEAEKDAKAIKMATGWERGSDGKWRYETSDIKPKPFEEWMNKKNLKLGDIIDSDSGLFEMYPELKDFKVTRGKGKSTNAAIYTGLGKIEINFSKFKPYMSIPSNREKIDGILHRVINHEIQHAIQDSEGFAQGVSPNAFRPDAPIGKLREMEEADGRMVERYNAMSYTEKALGEGVRLKERILENRKEYNALASKYRFGMDGYTRAAGEVEARNTEKRIGMTEEERRASLASETEDVAREDQILLGVDNADGEVNTGSVREHRVYHGSGADFDAFDHSHMGEGEGAQAYGWGTYVTEVEGIGRTYAIQNTTKHNDALRALQHDVDAISDQLDRHRDDLKYDEEQLKRANEWRAEAELDYELFKDEAEKLKEKYGESSPKYQNHLFYDIYTDEMKRAQSSVKSTEESIQYRREKIAELEKALKDKQAEIDELPKEFPRHLYTVEIPDDNGSNYLDWNGHPAESLLKGVGSFLESEGFERVQDSPVRYEKGESTVVLNPNATGADLYAELREALGSDKKASQALAELGCIGIKYPADNMRGGRKDGAKNYVIFNENDAKITDHVRFLRTADGEVYGLVKDGRIYLDPKVATSETAVHEYTHLWGDMLRRKDSEQWSHTVKELKNSVLWEEVKELYPELKTDDEIADEVLSTFSGRRGAERLREEARRVAEGDGGVFTKAKAIETLERVKEAIARFWEGVARMFGINRYRSAEELADMAMKDLLDSKNPMKDESGMRKRGEVGDEGVKSLKGEEAMVALDNIFEDKKTENMPQKVSSLVKFMELFRKPVRTFLGEVVNVKEEVYNKIIREKRTSISGAVLPTLENADFAIRDTDGSTLYIKRFKSENNDNVYNIAVVNKYGEVEDYVSSVHIKSDNNLRNKITKGAELLLPQERITDGILPRNNPTPTANVTNISELSKPRYSRKPGESIFDYASRVSEDVDRSVRERVSARDEYEKKVKSKGFQTKEALQNSMLGLQEFMYAIDHASGNKRYIEDIPDFENPILGENRLSSVNKEEMHQVAKTQFKPLMSAVAKLSGNGKESGELYDYMFAKHGLERDAVMRQREAQKEFDKYQKANPKGTKTIGDFVASLEGKDYAGLTALTAEDGRVKSIQSQIDAIDEQMKATDDQLLLRKLGGQKKRLKVDLLNAARDAADDIRKTFESNPSHDWSDINELWKRVNEVNGNTLRKLYESGMLTKEAYNDISSMYTNYIPMRGFDQTTSADAYAYLTHGDSAFNAPIKTAKGRSSKADNPIAYMQAMAESAIMQGNRNVLVKQKMLNFVRNHPSDLASVSDVWLQYDSVADEWKPVFPDNIGANDSASVVAKKMEAFEDKMKQMAEKHPDLVQRSNEAPDIPYKVVEKGQLNEHQVLVKQNGKSYIITVNGSPRAAQAANGLTNPDTDLTGAVGKVFEGAEALNRQLSSLYTTLNPDFIGSNYVRDALYSNTMVYVKEGAKYGGSFNLNFAKYNPAEMANLYARYNKGRLDTSNETHRLFLEFMQNGGETGFVNLKQIEKRKSEIAKAIKRDGRISAAQIWGGLSDAVDFANRAVENSARFAAYVTSRKSGRSVGRSVYDAKEISVNFNRKGSGRNWWKDNVGTSRFYDTEIGLVEINRASVGSSLAHRYSQVKLDVITSLAEGFNNAVYFGSMQDFSRQEGVKSHYFAYPINYNGNRNYVFCRAMQDANKSRLYVHEVFLADNIEKGNTLQTAASQPHGGITLYKDILANVLAANVTNDSETSKPCFSRKPGDSIFDYASRVSEDVDRSVCEGR